MSVRNLPLAGYLMAEVSDDVAKRWLCPEHRIEQWSLKECKKPPL
jgi:hypothetical protein